MLKTEIKQAIKLICDRYSHEIFYKNNSIKISSLKNEILISTFHNNIEIEYNIENENDKIIIKNDDEIYDILINIFRRNKNEKIAQSPDELITLKLLNEYEYDEKYTLEKVVEKIKSQNLIHKEIGGNRILQEYYNGYLVLMDDFYDGLKSNVIKI